MSLISALADAITRQEGSTQNNNPGNIWDGIAPGKPNRIWPNLPIDYRGFVIYPTLADGRAAMENQLAIKIGRGETLSQLINEWDSSDSAATRALYVSNVSQWTGLPTDIPLNQIGDASPPDPHKPLPSTHREKG